MADAAPKINKVAVIGAGVMGGGIAAQLADAGVDVVLLDIVPEGAANRNALAESALKKQRESTPPGFVLPRPVWRHHLRQPGRQSAHAQRLRLDHRGREGGCPHQAGCLSQDRREPQARLDRLFQYVDAAARHVDLRHAGEFRPRFHDHPFLQPAALHASARSRPRRRHAPGAADAIGRFADLSLGKTVVQCNDTPGFIANRIGGYWMMRGLEEAGRRGVPVEQADAAMGAAAGFPKTGIFGLFDLVGIDLMLHTAATMTAAPALPADDPLRKLDPEKTLALLGRMTEQGFTGRKGKGGFYRLNTRRRRENQRSQKPRHGRIPCAGWQGRTARTRPCESGHQGAGQPSQVGPYAWAVLSDTLCYAASIVAVIADGIAAVDEAMRKGYSWKHGPFEMIDILGVDWFIGKLEEEGRAVPQILEAARGKRFYITERGSRLALGTDGKYTTVQTPEGYLTLEDVKRRAPVPLASNNDASLWDMGDGIVCLELTTRDNVITPGVLQIISETLKLGHEQTIQGAGDRQRQRHVLRRGRPETIARGGAAGPAEVGTDRRRDQGRAACHAGAEICAVPRRVGARRQGAGRRLRAALAQ